MKWVRDEEFIRGSLPMTKFDARVLIMAMMEIAQGDMFLDVGAGTGSLSIQAALLGAEVYAIEKEPEGTVLIGKNADKFGVRVGLIQGTAPQDIDKAPLINKCFIGGSSGKLEQIIAALDNKLDKGGILAASFIIPDNLVVMKDKLKQLDYSDIEVRLIQSSVMDAIGLLKANNPIFIIKGKKQ
ncbi:MAG: precorrin-6Y C5,15-methyltransferase (decarboxylating), CbiT subunit [Clostridia bacterium]|jgi:cobalt-precorrin-6B (C15)-methyltransferase|nr:precorrin-6Y C5,15-methyltransferase (decarboxylating), CbiT subunit [Clostridia bacterium]